MKKTVLCAIAVSTLGLTSAFATQQFNFASLATDVHKASLNLSYPTLTFTNDTASPALFHIDLPPQVSIGSFFKVNLTNGGVNLTGCTSVTELEAGQSVLCSVAAAASVTITYDPTSCPASDSSCYQGVKVNYQLM